MNWCRSCILPSTRPNLTIQEDGICNACKAHTSKEMIDWTSREKAFCAVVKFAKDRANGYDCLIPVSGGKDSTWQTVKCLEYGLNPLAVTWKTPGRTDLGRKNLENLISLGVDHIDYQINPKVEARFMLKTLRAMGSTAIPMHLALFNIPALIATRFKIPLIVWGENSAFEYGAAKEAHTGAQLDEAWFNSYGVTHGTTAIDWVDNDLKESDLIAYFGPSKEEIKGQNINAVFLGFYFAWDPEVTSDIAQSVGFNKNPEGARVGYYDHTDIDDDFISLHHWMKWYKFGFTRTFDNLSLEIRNNRISREEAIEVIRQVGEETPHFDIERFCKFASIDENIFMSISERFRNLDIWEKDARGVWYIPDFLIPDWSWE